MNLRPSGGVGREVWPGAGTWLRLGPMQPDVPPAPAFPQRVPLKVIGRDAELDPARIAALIQEHLGVQPPADQGHQCNRRGAFTSLTFWVTLPDERSELPLRTAIQALPGVVMQL
jgi:hypothetical protein